MVDRNAQDNYELPHTCCVNATFKIAVDPGTELGVIDWQCILKVGSKYA